MNKWFSFVLVFASLLTISQAQTPPQSEPQTVADCLTTVQQYAWRQAEAARKAGQQPDYPAYLAKAKEIARQFAARFKVQDVREAELLDLAQLYLQADAPALAREAINRRFNSANLSEADRADTLVAAIGMVMKGAPSDENIKLGEEYAAQIDALSNAALKQKINAHSRMAGYYSYSDIDDKNLEHNTAVLKLIDQLPEEERQKYSKQKANNFARIALVEANRGLTDKALETLRRGKAEITDAKTTLDNAIELYSLVGKPGAPLKGAYWINAAPETKQLDPRGHVTLIQFTAHWCGPCRKSYPAMLKFYEQFHGRGLEVMMATELYGYFDMRRGLKPEEEMAANREYYLEHHKLPFKIAVEPANLSRGNSSDRAAAEAAQHEMNFGKYFVSGIPQIVLLDKQGIVRQILIGWDPANEARVTKSIEHLLKDPAVATK